MKSWFGAAGLLAVVSVLAFPAAGQDAAQTGRFVRSWWFQPGIEHGNPVQERRLRVNAPEAVLHPDFGRRAEARSSGMLQILMNEDLSLLEGAELYAELWGGHPGTANKRVSLNGRTLYPIAETGTASKNCTHQYPMLPIKLTDLVSGYNAMQFACDQGSSFWGHYIAENACIRAVLRPDHPDLAKAGLAGFQAKVLAIPGETGFDLALGGAQPAELAAVARVDYQAFYDGYDENGDSRTRDWHGFTKGRESVAFAAVSDKEPFHDFWGTSMLPAQTNVAVRAVVHFKNHPELTYVTGVVSGLKIKHQGGRAVRLYGSRDLPTPFWSRANNKATCNIELDVDPAQIEAAELNIVTWDGGHGSVEKYFTINGQFVPVAADGRHDVLYRKITINPRLLIKGSNRIELLSDTEHHGIEVLLPGPALMVAHREAKPLRTAQR